MQFTNLEFNIGWKQYPIFIAPEMLENEDCFGCVDFNTNRIYLTDLVDPGDFRNTLIHEILHVILEHSGYESHKTKITTDQEEMVTRIANSLMLYSQLNLDLFEILFNENKWQQHLTSLKLTTH